MTGTKLYVSILRRHESVLTSQNMNIPYVYTAQQAQWRDDASTSNTSASHSPREWEWHSLPQRTISRYSVSSRASSTASSENTHHRSRSSKYTSCSAPAAAMGTAIVIALVRAPDSDPGARNAVGVSSTTIMMMERAKSVNVNPDTDRSLANVKKSEA